MAPPTRPSAPTARGSIDDWLRKGRGRLALIAGAMVVVGAVFAVGAQTGPKSAQASGTDYSGTAAAATATSISLGRADAPVKIFIYEDFACAYCRELERATLDFLPQHAAKGRVQVEYRPVTTETSAAYSLQALNAWAAVLRNASPGAALQLHRLLFENQPVDGSALSETEIRDLVVAAGGENPAVLRALERPDREFLAASAQAARAVPLEGTPWVILDGESLAGLTVEQVVSAIERRVASAP